MGGTPWGWLWVSRGSIVLCGSFWWVVVFNKPHKIEIWNFPFPKVYAWQKNDVLSDIGKIFEKFCSLNSGQNFGNFESGWSIWVNLIFSILAIKLVFCSSLKLPYCNWYILGVNLHTHGIFLCHCSPMGLLFCTYLLTLLVL